MSSYQFNVVLHGSFAIMVDETENQIELRPPVVKDGDTFAHAYKYLINPSLSDKSVYNPATLADLHQNHPYELAPQLRRNVTNGAHPGGTELLVAGCCDIGEGDEPYCRIGLPMPDRVYGIRHTDENYLWPWGQLPNGQWNFTFTDNHLGNVTRVPLIHVLHYTFQRPPSISFDGKAVAFGADDNVARLHVFAEPIAPCCPGHPGMVLDAMNKLFNPNMTLSFVPNDPRPENPILPEDPQGAIPGFSYCEERSLSELSIPCSQFSSIYGDFLKDLTPLIFLLHVLFPPGGDLAPLVERPDPQQQKLIELNQKVMEVMGFSVLDLYNKAPKNCTSITGVQ